MRRFFPCELVVIAALIPSVASGEIAVPVAASTRVKAMQADAVVVGKVTGIDKETVDLEPYPGQPKASHTVATIKIETALLGVKNVTHLKLAFLTPGEGGQPGGGFGDRKRFPGRGFQPFVPAEDQEGVFFLHRHPTSDKHFVVQMGHNPILSSGASYKDELAKVTGIVATFADPVKALKADKAEDRVASALTLVQRYRTTPPNNTSGVLEETPIPAEETKLLLKVLTEVDWTEHADAPRVADVLGLVPGNYGLPRVAANDGEEPLAARQRAFRAWADKHADKYEAKKVAAKPLPTKGGR